MLDNSQDAPTAASAMKTPELQARDFLQILDTFVAHQEDLLHLADFIASRQREIDDRKERGRAKVALSFPNETSELFDKTWTAVAELLSTNKTTKKDGADDDNSDVADSSEASGPTPGKSTEGMLPKEEGAELAEGGGEQAGVAEGSGEQAEVAEDSGEQAEVAEGDGEQAGAGDKAGTPKDDLSARMRAVVDDIGVEWADDYFLAVLKAYVVPSNATPRLLSSLLTNLVGDFEVLLGNLLRVMLAKNTSSLGASERGFTWAEISKFDSLDAFKDHVFDTAVDNLLRGSYTDWLKYFRDKFKISTPSCSESGFILEAVQRRHVIVHNGGRVSKQYLEKVPDEYADVPVGRSLSVNADYLKDVADNLLVTGMSLVCVAAFKTIKDPKARTMIERRAGDILYGLLQTERYVPVRDMVSAHDSSHFGSPYTALVWKINGWLAYKRLGEFSKCEKEVVDWETEILEDQFKLAKHALLGNNAEAMEIVDKIRGTEALPLHFWAAWPLLAEVRDYELERKSAKATD